MDTLIPCASCKLCYVTTTHHLLYESKSWTYRMIGVEIQIESILKRVSKQCKGVICVSAVYYLLCECTRVLVIMTRPTWSPYKLTLH